MAEYSTRQVGALNTLDFRFFYGKCNGTLL